MITIFSEREEKIPKADDVVEGEVIKKESSFIYLNLNKLGVGIIWPADVIKNKNKLKKIKTGDKLLVKIVSPENEQGFIEVKPVEGQPTEFPAKFSAKITRVLNDGVVCQASFSKKDEFFVPLEDLPEPIKEKFEKKEDLMGQDIEIDESLSQSISVFQEKEKKEKIKEGDVLEGIVSNITSFGVFVKIKNREGLIPFSSPESQSLKMGKKIKVKITKISGDKIFLSLIS